MNSVQYYVNSTLSQYSDYYVHYYENTTGYIKTMGNYISGVPESPVLRELDIRYKPIHGYLAAIVCVFGVIANTKVRVPKPETSLNTSNLSLTELRKVIYMNTVMFR